jgi:hypothetical protein
MIFCFPSRILSPLPIAFYLFPKFTSDVFNSPSRFRHGVRVLSCVSPFALLLSFAGRSSTGVLRFQLTFRSGVAAEVDGLSVFYTIFLHSIFCGTVGLALQLQQNLTVINV